MTATAELRRQDLRRLKSDLSAFAEAVGWPLTAWQVAALTLVAKVTVLLSARQLGKSRALATLAVWWAFRQPGQRVVIISAGEDAARRLLRTVQDICGSPLLASSVVDEQASLVVLSNGSEIRSLPASERQVRGWSTDLLLLDECALIPDALVEGAALPTVMARPDSRVVMASSPWAQEGVFFRSVMAGDDERNTTTTTYRWDVSDADWVTEATIEHLRATLSPLRFAAEVEGHFVGSGDAFLSRKEVLDATAAYKLLQPSDARGQKVVVGLDWGRQRDSHCAMAIGQLLDFGHNGPIPPLFISWYELSQRPYGEQVAMVASMRRRRGRTPWMNSYEGPANLGGGLRFWQNTHDLAYAWGQENSPGYDVVQVTSETNGVGQYPSEQLAKLMRGVPVRGIHSSQQSKEDGYGRLRYLLSEGELILPADQELIRQLAGLAAEPLQGGGLRIQAANPAVHDDAPDALVLALSGVPDKLEPARFAEEPDGLRWLVTGNGIEIPAEPRPRFNGLRGASVGIFRSY